jgi:hypothetical protein
LSDSPATAPDQLKELKVRLPTRHHLALHKLKILRGKPMNESVCEALDAYFARKAHAATLQA